MPITHFATHHISKQTNKPSAIVEQATEEVDISDENYQQLFNKIKQIYIQRAGKRYGRFNSENLQMKGLTLTFLRDKQSFISWSQKVTQLLSEQLDNTELEIDGYILFATDQLADSDKIYIAHMREKIDFSISSEGSLQQSNVIDFSNTGFVLMLDQQGVLENDQDGENNEFFTFSYGRHDKPLQNQFTEALGFTDTVDTEQETQEFLSIVDKYTEQFSQQGHDEKAQQTRSQVIEYCIEQDKAGEPVAFKDISSQLDEQAPTKFQEFVAEQRAEARKQPHYVGDANDDSEPNTPISSAEKSEFIADRKSLKNYVRYSGRNKDLTISFAAASLGQDVDFDRTNNSLVLKNLPANLLNQLKQN